MTTMCDRRRRDDPQTVWDSIVQIGKMCMFYLGLFAFSTVLAFAIGYWVGSKEKTVMVKETACGSCKKGSGK